MIETTYFPVIRSLVTSLKSTHFMGDNGDEGDNTSPTHLKATAVRMNQHLISSLAHPLTWGDIAIRIDERIY